MGVFRKIDTDGSKCIDKEETLKFWYKYILILAYKNGEKVVFTLSWTLNVKFNAIQLSIIKGNLTTQKWTQMNFLKQ